MNVQWLYVYGTLRPGQYNWRLLEHTLAMPPFENVQARGRMYHIEGSTPDEPMYPVVDFNEDGVVIGTLLLVHEGQMGRVRAMELGAGYHEVTVPVRPSTWERAVEAVSYHFPHRFRGPLVSSGDWLQECRS